MVWFFLCMYLGSSHNPRLDISPQNFLYMVFLDLLFFWWGGLGAGHHSCQYVLSVIQGLHKQVGHSTLPISWGRAGPAWDSLLSVSCSLSSPIHSYSNDSVSIFLYYHPFCWNEHLIQLSCSSVGYKLIFLMLELIAMFSIKWAVHCVVASVGSRCPHMTYIDTNV